MDLYEIIRTLHEQRQRLDRIIRRLQEIEEPAQAGASSRRRELTSQEKREISRRLRPRRQRGTRPLP